MIENTRRYLRKNDLLVYKYVQCAVDSRVYLKELSHGFCIRLEMKFTTKTMSRRPRVRTRGAVRVTYICAYSKHGYPRTYGTCDARDGDDGYP